MSSQSGDKVFGGSIATIYQSHLVPLIFEPYAIDLVRRLEVKPGGRVLEVAAGTGVVTRTMAASFPTDVSIGASGGNRRPGAIQSLLALSQDDRWTSSPSSTPSSSIATSAAPLVARRCTSAPSG